MSAIWLVPALPLAGFVTLVVFGRRLGNPMAGWLATGAVGGSFVAGVVSWLGLLAREDDARQLTFRLFEWVPVGGLSVDAAFLVDPLSITMVLFVTGVSTLIHVYSVGYMHDDPRFATFFIYLNLFAASMLVLVLGDNLLITFLGWEGVGVCSYLLVSFWFDDEANAVAGKKAFITNRVGDVGFMVAMFLAFSATGTLTYAGSDGLLASAGGLAPVTAGAIALLLFVGAAGKSAQLPLYVWLPDAMAGPTPVSALIHAATMVTSGVYLMVRVNPVLAAGPGWVPTLIASVGAATALFAATAALAQRDIKRVLAYSTVSQLGYMFLAVGSGAYVAAVFHMITHAFFKALLFLGAGSVIHGTNDTQDMGAMGGLRRFLPWTAGAFIVGWLAIAGVPPFSGFFSKDEILLYAFEASPVLWAVGLITAVLTAYYMSRQVFLVFFGTPRWSDDRPTPHEAPPTMLAPVLVLAALALVGGGLNLPFTSGLHFLGHFLEPVVAGNEASSSLATGGKIALAVLAGAAALLGIVVAALVYLQRRIAVVRVEPDLLRRAWGVDDALSRVIGGPVRLAANMVTDVIDRTGIDGAVNGVARAVASGGNRLRVLQTGFVRSYALGIALGAAALLVYFLSRAAV